MSSIIPLAIVAGVWYHLARQGMVTTTVWLGCNLLDTFRALRLIRPSGRAVGQRTRRKAMRDSLICWTSFILIQQVGGIPDKLLGWLPIYSLVRSIVVAGLLFARVSASETIYFTIIYPTLRQYETPIDLSIEFITSITQLVYHFTLQYPLIRLRSTLTPYVEQSTILVNPLKTAGINTPNSEDTPIDLTQIVDLDQDITEIEEANMPVSVASGSKIRHLVEVCEKRSPARPTREERAPVPATRSPLPPRVALSLENDAMRANGRQPSNPQQATTSTTDRPGPSRTTTSKAQALVRPSKITQRQPTTRSAFTAKETSGILTQSRPVPTASDANIARPDPPLVKAKSDNHLKSNKPYVTDITATRPVKSAPTRRIVTKQHPGDDPNSPRAKKLAHAAERAREIRERRRREPGVTPGEKRPPPVMSNIDAPGSKRTRISVVRD